MDAAAEASPQQARIPTAHLLHGLPGCGKTTFAKRLEQERRVVRFSPDEWMVRLYGSNPPAAHFAEYADRINELVWEHVDRVLRVGVDVIVDAGFWSRRSRDDAGARVVRAGGIPRLYAFACSREEMLQRVIKRSRELPEGALWINEQAFASFLQRYEPLQPDEEHVVVAASQDAEPAPGTG